METPVEFWEVMFAVVAPLLLAVVEVFHPHPHDLFAIDLNRWLFVHYAQVLLFPLSAFAVAILVRRQSGLLPTMCRLAMFVFGVSYTVFDTAAGLVTGTLIKAAIASGNPDAWRPAIETIWTHPILGSVPAPMFAVLGSIALSIGAVLAAISLKRSGAAWGPILLLAISSFGISIFKTHAWPGGPLTFGGIGLAAAWLLWERRSVSETATLN